ncbi:MAG: DUF3849 domain-containing protein, partial [Ruminococcus sp.]|nr:DUF3849 domain-containing protein [Ruminococcus sp.]
MNEYYNKEYYNQIKGKCAFIELNPENVKNVMRALYDCGINFSAVYGGYRNTVTVSKDDEVRARTIAGEHRNVNRFNQRVIGNTDYRSIKDRNYINTTPEIALQVSAILSGDSKVSFSGVIKEKSATLTVSRMKNADTVNRIIDNLKNADIINAMSQAGFERLPDNNGFIVIRNTSTGETAGFGNMAMVRDMWNDGSNEFFHAPAYSVGKAEETDNSFYLSHTDGQNERNVYVDENMTAPMFPAKEAAEHYAENNGIPLAQYEAEKTPAELWEDSEPKIKGNPVIDTNLDLIDKFDRVGDSYPDAVYYDDRAECFTWLHYDEYAAPDGALVEKTFTEEDVFAAYTESLKAKSEESARDMFISAVNDKAEKVNILVNDPAFTESADIYMNSIEYGNALSVFSVYEDGKADVNAGKFIEYLENNTAAVREDKARREQEDAKNAVIRSCYDRLKIAVLENEAVKNAAANTDFQNAHIEALSVMEKEAMNIFNENIYGNIDFYADFFGGKMTENRIALEEEITAALRRIYAEKEAERNISEVQESPAEEKITAAPAYRDVPFYSKSFEYAQEAGEVDLFRKSRRENEECAQAIDKYSDEFYSNYIYDSEAVLNAVLSEFPLERVEYVAAANVASANYDGRLSRANIEWAENYMNGLPDEYRKISGIYLRTHKGLLNMFAEAVHKYTENERVSEKAENRINEAESLRQQFVDKVKTELSDFLANPNGASEYQVNMKKDIAGFIIGNDNLELSELQFTTLLSRPHVLSELYEEWRSSNIDGWNEEVMTAFISDTALSISESIERNSESSVLAQAKTHIREYLDNEFGSEETFANLRSVSIGYTELGENNEYHFQAEADLVEYNINFYLDNQIFKTLHYDTLEEMNEFLNGLNFDDVIAYGNEEIDSRNPDEISKVLDLARNNITFSVIYIEGENPVVTGTTYVDSEDITELDEYQNYILKTGKKHADVTVEYYDIGNDSESFPAEDGEASYIQEHLDEVIRHSSCINLETNTFSVNTPDYLLEEYAQENSVFKKAETNRFQFTVLDFGGGFEYYEAGHITPDNLKETAAYRDVLDNAGETAEVSCTVTNYELGSGEIAPVTHSMLVEIEENFDEIEKQAAVTYSEDFSVNLRTPEAGKVISGELAFQMWENGFEVYADGKAIDGYDFKNYDNVIKVSEIFRDESILFSSEEKDIETNALIDAAAEAAMEVGSEYVSLDYVIDSADWLVSGYDGDPY